MCHEVAKHLELLAYVDRPLALARLVANKVDEDSAELDVSGSRP
jgi:hypothetical protein